MDEIWFVYTFRSDTIYSCLADVCNKVEKKNLWVNDGKVKPLPSISTSDVIGQYNKIGSNTFRATFKLLKKQNQIKSHSLIS